MSGGELIDNVAFGNAGATVPEPSSLVLLTGGLAMLLRLRRKTHIEGKNRAFLRC
jgi:hypothetical protein